MENLLPSEIARVVLGYLQEEKCPKIAGELLEKSKYLSECLEEAQAGEEISTRPYGKSLKEMMKEYCDLLKIDGISSLLNVADSIMSIFEHQVKKIKSQHSGSAAKSENMNINVNQNVKKLPVEEKAQVSKKDTVEQLAHLLKSVPDNPVLDSSLKGCRKED